MPRVELLKKQICARMAKLQPSHWMRSTLLKDSSNLCLGQMIRLGLQGVYFVFIARSLGPSQYGAFVAITAMTSIMTPYVGLGAGVHVFQECSLGQKRSGSLLGERAAFDGSDRGAEHRHLLCSLSLVVARIPVTLVGAICISDLILIRFIDLASCGFAASGQMSKTAVQNTTMSFLRVIGICIWSGIIAR